MGSPLRCLYELVQSPRVRFVWTQELWQPIRHRGGTARSSGSWKWLQAVQVTQSVVTGAGKRDLEQQQGMAWQLKRQGV